MATTRGSSAASGMPSADRLVRLTAVVAEADELAKANRNGAYLEFERLERDLEIAKQRTRQVELCAQNPNCTIIVSDGSAGVNVSGK